jgi:hypothetical protein
MSRTAGNTETSLTLTAADFADTAGKRLTREDVPPVPDGASRYTCHTGNVVFDAEIDGVGHRWRFHANGGLLRFFIYKPKVIEPSLDGLKGMALKRALHEINELHADQGSPWAAAYFAEAA